MLGRKATAPKVGGLSCQKDETLKNILFRVFYGPGELKRKPGFFIGQGGVR